MNLLLLLTGIIKPLLYYPDILQIEDSNNESKKSVIVKLDASDMKNFLGDKGKIFRSLRTLIRFSLKDHSIDLVLDVVR